MVEPGKMDALLSKRKNSMDEPTDSNSRGRREISLLITDLDNTLWDWFEAWYGGFRALLDGLLQKVQIGEEDLKAQIKTIHTKHQTSEYSFLLEELPCVLDCVKSSEDIDAQFREVILASQEGRRRASRLYPGVLETLEFMHEQGTKVVGFTESQLFYTKQRLRTFGLDGLIDILYSTQDRGGVSKALLRKARKKPDDYYELKWTIVRRLPFTAKKPDPALLKSIISDLQIPLESTTYVGDNLHKDVAMAQQVGVCAVHAKYGESHKDKRYELLKAVTHWTPDDVHREKTAVVKPDFTIQSFKELKDLFTFGPKKS